MSQSPTEKSATAAEESSASSDAGVLYVGIDLGTSRTSVAASNGVRVTLASYVGYPKDVVSKKLLKQDILYGDDAIAHRLSLDLYRPLEHGVLKVTGDGSAEDKGNLRASRDLLIEAIRRARPRKDELVYAVIGAPAQASITSKSSIVDIARECVDSVMLCSEPFAVAYGQDMLDDVLVIDIGAEGSAVFWAGGRALALGAEVIPADFNLGAAIACLAAECECCDQANEVDLLGGGEQGWIRRGP